MKSFEEAFGRVIADERRRAGLSQEALAYRCKLHPTYISQLERGIKSPTLRVLRAIARALETTGSEILRRTEKAADMGCPDSDHPPHHASTSAKR